MESYTKESGGNMEKLKPKLFSVMKTYTKEQFVKDVISGIIVSGYGYDHWSAMEKNYHVHLSNANRKYSTTVVQCRR